MSGASMPDLVYRPAFVRGLAVATWSMLAAVAVMLGVEDAGSLVRWLPPLALVAVASYALFWRPAVAVDDEKVVLRNLLRDVHVPWGRLEAVDTRFALTLHTDAGRFVSWAAPAPGRLAGATVVRSQTHGLTLLGGDPKQGVTASAAPASDSGGAALMVRLRWEQVLRSAAQAHRGQRAGGRAAIAGPGGDEPRVTVAWSVPLLAALAVCTGATLLAATTW